MEICEKCLKPIKDYWFQIIRTEIDGIDRYYHEWCYEELQENI